MAQTFLITGGGGNLSRQLAAQLVAEGDRAILFDIAPPPPATHSTVAIQYIRGDVTSRDDLNAALTQYQPDVLLHMASLLSGKCEQDRTLGWQVNVTATVGLFELALEHRVRTVFFPSSLAAYGGDLPYPLPEDAAQWPEGIYGVTKATVERLGFYYHHRHNLDFRCIRLPLVISRFAPPGAASAYVSRAFVEAVETGRFTFKVNPTTGCCTAYVRDVLDGIRRIVRAPEAKLTRRVYNIHGLSPSAGDIAGAIAARVPGANLRFEPDEAIARLIESWPRTVDDGAARRDWGWSPRYDLDALADDFIGELRREFADSRRV